MKRMLLVLLSVVFFSPLYGQTPSATDIQQGRRIWSGYVASENDCKNCHGENGEGGFSGGLAGHRLTNEQFLRAVRQGVGKIMPGFVADKNLSDQQIFQIAEYLRSLPKYTGPAAYWRTRVPPLATARQKLYVETGCGQCHAETFHNPRRTAGGLGGDWEWFKAEVYSHTSSPDHSNARHLRMGNYTRDQVPEATLQEIWKFLSEEQGLRPNMDANISVGVLSDEGVTYTITVVNRGQPGKGLTAEYVTVVLPLARGRDPEEVTTTVVATSGEGYFGVHRDPLSNSNSAGFAVPKIAPGEKREFTVTLSGIGATAGITRGTVRWERPKLPSGGVDMLMITPPPLN